MSLKLERISYGLFRLLLVYYYRVLVSVISQWRRFNFWKRNAKVLTSQYSWKKFIVTLHIILIDKHGVPRRFCDNFSVSEDKSNAVFFFIIRKAKDYNCSFILYKNVLVNIFLFYVFCKIWRFPFYRVYFSEFFGGSTFYRHQLGVS